MKTLCDRSKVEYERILARARDAEGNLDHEKIKTWSRGQIIVLRAALRREASGSNAFAGLDEDDEQIKSAIKSATRGLPRPGDFKRKVSRGISEAEAISYETAANALRPAERAVALLPLLLGLRASEVLNLSRGQVEDAIETGELVLVRKGGNEASLPVVGGVRELLVALLAAPCSTGKLIKNEHRGGRPKHWEHVREILSPGAFGTAYQKLRRIVRAVGAAIPGIRPHKLRHAFATRMHRDGAPLAAIQWALGHADLSTTMIYVHGDAVGGAKFFRSTAAPRPQGGREGEEAGSDE